MLSELSFMAVVEKGETASPSSSESIGGSNTDSGTFSTSSSCMNSPYSISSVESSESKSETSSASFELKGDQTSLDSTTPILLTLPFATIRTSSLIKVRDSVRIHSLAEEKSGESKSITGGFKIMPNLPATFTKF
ncbi:hypothetical protein L2E82_29968 [Cichorium intybus]|uniref:Uncharacterized protein n=1 Tax=Cichorium intybus TaxID=13427 RepID=A0ACB9CZ32_CICIN|nr:hypothetical protein L2E82_29968 [Cichorium intybus]